MKVRIKAIVKLNFYGRKSNEELFVEFLTKEPNIIRLEEIDKRFSLKYEYFIKVIKLLNIEIINKVQRLSKHTKKVNGVE